MSLVMVLVVLGVDAMSGARYEPGVEFACARY